VDQFFRILTCRDFGPVRILDFGILTYRDFEPVRILNLSGFWISGFWMSGFWPVGILDFGISDHTQRRTTIAIFIYLFGITSF